MEFLVPTKMSVTEALLILYPDSSKRTLRNWLEGKRFTADNRLLSRMNESLEAGQTLRSIDTFSIQKNLHDVKILFEDRFFVVIDKPVGLLSVPLDQPSSKRHALGILRDHYQTDQILAVHRIDRETSGTLLFARGTEAQEAFQGLFEAHDLQREYFAIVEGRVPQEKGTWECILRELPNFDVEICQDLVQGKKAITHFEVIKRSTKYTYLRFLLETGRKHQIRVQCKQAGFPVLGDTRYEATEDPIKRLALHARRLAFTHPFAKRSCHFISPIPASFKKLGATDELLLHETIQSVARVG